MLLPIGLSLDRVSATDCACMCMRGGAISCGVEYHDLAAYVFKAKFKTYIIAVG